MGNGWSLPLLPFFFSVFDENEKGLTPELFWAHNAALLSADRSELSELVAELVEQPTISNSSSLTNYPPIPISKVSGKLAMCWISDIPLQDTFGVEINPKETAPNTSVTTAYIVLTSSQNSLTTPHNNVNWLYIPLHHERKKKGDMPYLFTTILPSSSAFIKSRLPTIKSVCVAIPKDDSDARDVGVGIMLVALQLLFDDHGEPVDEASIQLPGMLLLFFSVIRADLVDADSNETDDPDAVGVGHR